MAQEANGLPYLAGNPTGTGAVYFDKTVEPLTNLNANLKTLDDTDDFWKMWKLKELDNAKKAKLAEDITKDLAANPEGAMPEDIEGRFKPKMQEIMNRYADVVKRVGGNNSNLTRDPEYLKIKGDIMGVKAEIEQSKEWQKSLTSQAGAYQANIDKFEDNFNSDASIFRTSKFEDKGKMFSERNGMFLKPATPQFFEELGKRREKGLYKPSEIENPIYDSKSDRYGTQKIVGYTPADLDRNAQAIFTGEPKMVMAATKDFNMLGQKSPALRDQIIQDANKEGVDPIQKFIRKQLEDSQQVKSDYANLAWSPWQQEDAQGKSDEGFVNFVMEQGGNLLTGNKEVYNIGIDGKNSVDVNSFTGEQPWIEQSFSKPVYSDKLQGMMSGTFSYVENTKDDFSEKVIKSELKNAPNIVLSFKWENGKPFIKTTETAYKLMSGQKEYSSGQPIDEEGYKPASSSDIEKVIGANSKDPAKAIEKYRTALIKQKAYPSKIAKPEMTVTPNPIKTGVEIKIDKQGTKKNFTSLTLDDKKQLQSQSGAKTKEEFQKWLDKNGYT